MDHSAQAPLSVGFSRQEDWSGLERTIGLILSKPLSYGEESAKTQRGLSRVTDHQAGAAVNVRPGGET